MAVCALRVLGSPSCQTIVPSAGITIPGVDITKHPIRVASLRLLDTESYSMDHLQALPMGGDDLVVPSYNPLVSVDVHSRVFPGI